MTYRVYEIVENSEGEMVKISWGERIGTEMGVVDAIVSIMQRQQEQDNYWIKRLASVHIEVVEDEPLDEQGNLIGNKYRRI